MTSAWQVLWIVIVKAQDPHTKRPAENLNPCRSHRLNDLMDPTLNYASPQPLKSAWASQRNDSGTLPHRPAETDRRFARLSIPSESFRPRPSHSGNQASTDNQIQSA